ncbi:hypothetical protein F4692_000262 [Nocardioides cavernae]|uniref:Uncharacterized protein n=1 Tax=Nocardioides cavernae TaxID=1921566 RepID=A0A7Y9KRU6_9ACTN|nr:hypothetical protein [Nocardioides cavernae]NYE35158.1 hypothetical protein [Nocardioides cavernae]
MQLLDPTPVLVFLLAVVGLAALASLALVAIALPAALRTTRIERLARRESIPAYYGRLHFVTS